MAYNRKQAGLLVTTAAGVAGSVLTAVYANQAKADEDGDVDAKNATIVGAATAGATTLAGVVSLFVVGTGADNDLQRLADYGKNIAETQTNLNTSCASVDDANAVQCRLAAKRTLAYCRNVACSLKWKVNGVRC